MRDRPAHGGYPTPLGNSDADLARAWHDAHRAARTLAAAQFPDAAGMIELTPTAIGRFVVVPLVVVEPPVRPDVVVSVAGRPCAKCGPGVFHFDRCPLAGVIQR